MKRIFYNRSLFILAIILLMSLPSRGQELFCTVDINAERANLSDKSIFEEIKKTIFDFMTRRWTNDEFQPEEQIKCNIFITIMSASATASSVNCQATAQIQFSRPVFNASYESIMFNFLDKKFDFDYNQGQIMDFNENAFMNNLSSMLAFYAYVILGTDYDSFTKLGGTKYFETARNIANTADQSGGSGWNQGETNGRYWLSENLNSQVMIPFREVMYDYHRLGLDTFYEDMEEGRKLILEGFKEIRSVNKNKPNTVLLRSFFMAKSSEIINIFLQAPPEEKQSIVPLLKELDPLNSEKYDRIMKNN
ncbi:MAG: DUF4835 family protein [Cytophagaceae bacterium]